MSQQENNNLCIVMPAYNEVDSIESVVLDWYPIVASLSQDSCLVIADSGSQDGTHEKLLALQQAHPQLKVLSNTKKEHGPKLMALYKYAIDCNYDFVFQTDSDGQTNPDEFVDFWLLRNNYNAIFGYRYARGDGRTRAFVEQVVCFLLNRFFNVKVPDANAPFRLMRCSSLAKYIDRLPNDYNLPNIMLTAYYVHNNERVCFKEISFGKREAGVNSINISKIVRIGLHALKDFNSFRKDFI